MHLTHQRRPSRPERSVDFPSNPTRGKGRQARLGAPGLHGMVELVPPFPDIRFGGGNDRELDALVEHGRFLVAKSEQRERDWPCSINPGNYGLNQFTVFQVDDGAGGEPSASWSEARPPRGHTDNGD